MWIKPFVINVQSFILNCLHSYILYVSEILRFSYFRHRTCNLSISTPPPFALINSDYNAIAEPCCNWSRPNWPFAQHGICRRLQDMSTIIVFQRMLQMVFNFTVKTDTQLDCYGVFKLCAYTYTNLEPVHSLSPLKCEHFFCSSPMMRDKWGKTQSNPWGDKMFEMFLMSSGELKRFTTEPFSQDDDCFLQLLKLICKIFLWFAFMKVIIK